MIVGENDERLFFMTKESKNILTRESCQKELVRWAKGEMIPDVVLVIVMLLIFVPLFVACVYVAKNILVLGIMLALMCTIVPAFFIYKIVRDIIKMCLVKQGAFSIVKDTVSRISKGEVPKNYSEGRHTVDVVYFAKYGRCTSMKTPFDISSEGDEFYLVVLHGKKDQIVFAYHSMMYECKVF